MASPINDAMISIKKREDTIDRARKINEYKAEATKIFNAAKDTSDLSLSESMQKLNDGLQAKQDDLLAAHGGTTSSNAALLEALENHRAATSAAGAQEGVKIQRQVVDELLGDELGGITQDALRDPGAIQEYFDQWDAIVDGMADGMDEGEELEKIEKGRAAIVLNAVSAFTSRGNYLKSKKLIDENPQIMDSLDPAQQRKLITEISTGLETQRKANNAGNIKVQTAEQILGRSLTQPERIKLAGLTAAGPKTSAEKIADIEEAIGRSLSAAEKEVAVGLTSKASAGTSKFTTDYGKALNDADVAAGRWGEGSERHRAFLEVAAEVKEGKSETKLTEVAGLRKEFTKLSGDYLKLRDAMDKIEVSAKNPNPAGDLALIFNFMKMLDPGSTVREGEFATAEQAGPLPTRLVALYNKVATKDGRLEAEQRKDFVDRAGLIMGTQQLKHEQLEEQFKAIAKRQGWDPRNVVIDFVGDDRPSVKGDGLPGDDGGPPASVEIDLSGKALAPQTTPVTAPVATADSPEGAPTGQAGAPAEDQPAPAKRDPKAPIDFKSMDAPTIGQLDIAGMSPENKKAMGARLKELGF